MEIQQRVCLRKIHNVHELTLWHVRHGFEQLIIKNATDDWCKRLWVCFHAKGRLLSIQFDCRFYICTFLYVNLVKIKVRWHYCVACNRISPFFDFYISQGSVATELRCDGKMNTILLHISCEIKRWKILINQHLAKLWTNNIVCLFYSQCWTSKLSKLV